MDKQTINYRRFNVVTVTTRVRTVNRERTKQNSRSCAKVALSISLIDVRQFIVPRQANKTLMETRKTIKINDYFFFFKFCIASISL